MKMKSFVVAALMVACIFAAAVYADASDAESAPTSAPEIKFWAYEEISSGVYDWVSYSGHGYYAGQAIANSGLDFEWGEDEYLTDGQMTETQGAITHRTEVYDASFGIISSRF